MAPVSASTKTKASPSGASRRYQKRSGPSQCGRTWRLNTGVSGGGTLTLWSVTHTHRFRAAVSIKPVPDWQSWVLGADIGASVGLTWMEGETPWEAPEKYRARSPLAYAQYAQTPTLLMAGEADSRTPASEAMQMYSALRLAGVEAYLMLFPGTSHSSGAMRPSLFAAEVAATIGWFNRYLA